MFQIYQPQHLNEERVQYYQQKINVSERNIQPATNSIYLKKAYLFQNEA